jgi:hypothetical protein
MKHTRRPAAASVPVTVTAPDELRAIRFYECLLAKLLPAPPAQRHEVRFDPGGVPEAHMRPIVDHLEKIKQRGGSGAAVCIPMNHRRIIANWDRVHGRFVSFRIGTDEGVDFYLSISDDEPRTRNKCTVELKDYTIYIGGWMYAVDLARQRVTYEGCEIIN